MTPCAGCLDDRRCWVCLGTGLIDDGRHGIKPCHRCYGSGACFVCRPILLGDIGDAPAIRVERRWWQKRRRDTA